MGDRIALRHPLRQEDREAADEGIARPRRVLHFYFIGGNELRPLLAS